MIAISARTESPFKFEIERKKIILVALGVFEFSHNLGRTEKNSVRADVFRFALELRHCSIQCEEEVRSRTKTPFAPWLSVVAFGLPRENASNRSAVRRRNVRHRPQTGLATASVPRRCVQQIPFLRSGIRPKNTPDSLFGFYVSSRETQQHTGKSADQTVRYGPDARVRQPETFHCFSRETG